MCTLVASDRDGASHDSALGSGDSQEWLGLGLGGVRERRRGVLQAHPIEGDGPFRVEQSTSVMHQ